ncbi:MAG: hypothetical protein KAX58_02180 [Aeromonadaceae bacterium]|nr:hypothetical protein [Aeromonadaceae bacterium]
MIRYPCMSLLALSLAAVLTTSLTTVLNPALASTPKPTAQAKTHFDAQQQAAAETCKSYVSFRLGSLLSLNVTQVSAPKPPSLSWIVVGEDKSKTPAVSFICHLWQKNQRWELEKLELLQLAEPQQAQASTSSVNALSR